MNSELIVLIIQVLSLTVFTVNFYTWFNTDVEHHYKKDLEKFVTLKSANKICTDYNLRTKYH